METKAVYKAISAVAAELAEQGIKKSKQQGSQVNYAFRGIDAVYNALAPALVKHKLLMRHISPTIARLTHNSVR